MKKAIIYINQFFANVGGESEADYKPEIREGVVGSALALSGALKGHVEITHTIICGDNYMGEHIETAPQEVLALLEGKEIDFFFAGPAFRAGRYGVACGTVCKAVQEKYNIPVITSMDIENPGVEMFKKDMYIFKGNSIARYMKDDSQAMAKFAIKLVDGSELFTATDEGYFGRGIRKQVWTKNNVPASERVFDMLMKKIKGEDFVSELIIPKKDLVPIAKPVTKEELAKMEVAVITTGGIVPVGNPDRIQSASATKWGKYDMTSIGKLEAGKYQTIHAGFDPAAANADPNRIMPLDAMRAYEKESKIGGVYKYFYSTVGTGTTQAEGARMGQEIGDELIAAGVKVAIMVST